jgi:hypothetical protein
MDIRSTGNIASKEGYLKRGALQVEGSVLDKIYQDTHLINNKCADLQKNVSIIDAAERAVRSPPTPPVSSYVQKLVRAAKQPEPHTYRIHSAF